MGNISGKYQWEISVGNISGNQMEKVADKEDLIKVVGISASGKSTLVRRLRELGYNAVPVSQEHSEIPYLWEMYGTPRFLIYLSISLEAQRRRRPDVTWTQRAYHDEAFRLIHAYGHANVRIDTSSLTTQSIVKIATLSLSRGGILPGPEPLPLITPTGMNRDMVKPILPEEPKRRQSKRKSKRNK